MNGVDMSQTEPTPVLLAESKVEQGAELLARAFQDAPDMKFFIGDETKMLDKSTIRFYKAVIIGGLLYGKVYTTPSMDGIAVWASPETTNFSFGVLFRTGLLSALFSLGFRPMLRFINSSSYVQKLQHQVITEPRWVLIYLGIEPSQQGKGIGGILIQPILARADADGVPCYVESADERNLTFYKRHGFEIVNHGQVPNGGPQVWVMVREPD
jgi:ribosomal protein S18 acetylase RimI-like enzyme